MPYEGEISPGRSLRRFESDKRLQRILSELDLRSGNGTCPLPARSFVAPSDILPEYIIAVDGSSHELPLRNGFPGSQLCYLSIVSVLLKIATMREADKDRPIPPARFKGLEDAEAMTAVLTGANVIRHGESDARRAFRRYFFEALDLNGVDTTVESLRGTYEHLLGLREGKQPLCPYRDHCGSESKSLPAGSGQYKCSCNAGLDLFSTDALDVHNSLDDNGANGRLFGEALQVVENLWLINVIRYYARFLDAAAFSSIGFVMDGPLRIDGEPAWLARAIKKELRRINDDIVARGGRDLLLIGVEKAGAFNEHFQLLDVQASGSPSKLAPQTLFLLDNQYIRQNIKPGPDEASQSKVRRPWGEVTYFGRKLFYKTKTKALICATLPYLRDGDDDVYRAEPSQYPRLEDVLTILDQLASARYPNAILPVMAAHAEASIPLTQGRKVLEMLTKQKSTLLK